MTTLIDGKALATKIKENLKVDIEEFTKATGVVPGLATILVGDDGASKVYIKNKIKSAATCGIESFHHNLPEKTTQQELLELIQKLNVDDKVHGILVQLPLPDHINDDFIIHAIDPKKDADGFHPENMGRLLIGQEGIVSCTPAGVMEMLVHYNISLKGKDVLIIGRSNIVGKPQAILMLREHATVTMAHSRTIDLDKKAQQADVIVAAVGRAKMVKADWVKEGAVVIDVGMNRDENGKLCGDVDFENVKDKTSFITPVPGGVGPMTIAMLMKNTFQAAVSSLK
ncbi:MAG: bifunctional methylenetetrahydrofolate dehydrogenase/methenyltetrahydrofolate cyclohydrolase FolD [bacterium]|nr:bifunctional methylenetetrahydrofolate dehydrogenase/methenyltetrahydrofolate cyclohydrolase FolD [bacterium]MBU1918280.1 bifunctional methylenetetrahydrofolate dehydrogenase/methenyltetrahydrofolate cyclohydrolase FolD [bacterium]